MFGTTNVIAVLDLQHAPEEVRDSSEGAVARLLDLTDHPKIEKWVQFVIPNQASCGSWNLSSLMARCVVRELLHSCCTIGCK
jgi:hypothetical protein